VAKKAGKAFEHEFANSLEVAREELKLWWTRIYDMQDYIGRRCPVCKKRIDVCPHCKSKLPTIGAIPPKRPADFYAIYLGKVFFFECKSAHNKKYYQTRWVKDHQIESLLALDRAGARAYLAINNRSHPRRMKLYILPIQRYLRMRLATQYKYIKWEDMEKAAVLVAPRIGVGDTAYYEIGRIFKPKPKTIVSV